MIAYVNLVAKPIAPGIDLSISLHRLTRHQVFECRESIDQPLKYFILDLSRIRTEGTIECHFTTVVGYGRADKYQIDCPSVIKNKLIAQLHTRVDYVQFSI